MKALGKYRIEATLGKGAMGCVYKAWHPGFHDYVALKTIQDSRLEDAQLLERFKREGLALAKLKHQNIVQIYDADQANGIHFIVMEYMNGGSLDRVIETQDNSPLAKRVGYIVPACHALSYAHRRGLFHRDIKPANIMLHFDGNDEIVKVVDFGIARLVDLTEKRDFSLSQTNMLIGAPAYMAPELLAGTDRANERTDIWALGVTLYELISFERPFQGEELRELKDKIIRVKPRSLCQVVPECPSELDTIVQRMLEKDPSSRYQSVEDLLIDLEPIVKGLRCQTAGTLIRKATELCEIGEVENAKSVLTEARRYDPSNTQIRELLHKVDQELRRRELLPRVYGHLKRAREYSHVGNCAKAKEEIALALSLDPSFEPAKQCLGEIEEEARKSQLVQEKLRQTRQRVAEGALTQAQMLLKEIEALDSNNAQLLELRAQIEEENQRREKRKQLNEILNRARVLMAAADYNQCIELLNQGLLQFPADGELRKLQALVRDEIAEASRQQERQRGIDQLRGLVTKGDCESAHNKALELLRLFPNDVVIERWSILAKDGIEKAARLRKFKQRITEIQSLVSNGQTGPARQAVQELMNEYPAEMELDHLLDAIDLAEKKRTENETRGKRAELVKKQTADEAIEQGVSSVRKMIELKRYGDATAAAEILVLRFPTEPRARAVLQEASVALREQKRQVVHIRAKEIRQKINKEQYEEAVEEATSTLAQFGPEEQIEALLRAAQVELREHRIGEDAQESKFSETRALLADGKTGEALELVQNAIDTNIFKKSDPRVTALMADIQNWKGSSTEILNGPVTEQTAMLSTERPVEPVNEVVRDGGAREHTEYRLDLPPLKMGDHAPQIDGSEPRHLAKSTLIVVTLAVTVFGVIFGAVSFMNRAKLKGEENAFRQALGDQQQKRWPQALEEFRIIQAAHGRFSAEAEQEYGKVSALLESEQTLRSQAETARENKDYIRAEHALIEIVNLHGDMEDAASAELDVVKREAMAAKQKQELDRSLENLSPKKEQVPVSKGSGCELSASDLTFRLSRADRNRANGDFETAISEYEDVLKCEPNNKDARSGLERARIGRNM